MPSSTAWGPGVTLLLLPRHQQMGSTGDPVDGAYDHGAVVDHSELVWLETRSAVPAWFLRKAVGR